MRVKDIGASAQRFATRAGNASGDYSEGVKGAGEAWKRGAGGASQNWADGTSKAVANGTYKKAIDATPSDKYTKAAGEMGARRYREGVNAAGPTWQAGFAPIADALRNFEPPTPKRERGNPNNYARVQEVGERMRAASRRG